jgi:hypothetical protein
VRNWAPVADAAQCTRDAFPAAKGNGNTAALEFDPIVGGLAGPGGPGR